MDVTEIITVFEQSPQIFPREAIREAIRQKDQIIPELLTLIERPDDLLRKCEQQPSYMGHIYALLLLAQFRVTRALPLILNIFGHTHVQVDLLGGDFVTGDLARIVASVYAGDPTPLKNIIENPSADEYVRDAMLRALQILVIHGQMPREALVGYCTLLLREKLERIPSFIWCSIAKICGELADPRLLDDIKATYADDLVDSFFIEIEDVEEDIARGWDHNREYLAADLNYNLVEDVDREMEWWACFNQREGHDRPPRSPSAGIGQKDWMRDPPYPRPKTPPKIGRNQPCPCGSGKKYKKCCGSPVKTAKGSNTDLVRRLEIRDNLPVYHECPRCKRPAPGEDFDLMCRRCFRELDYETKVQEGKRFPPKTRQSTLFGAGLYKKP